MEEKEPNIGRAVKERYKKEGRHKLAEEFNVSHYAIYRWARKFGVQKKKPNLETVKLLIQTIKDRFPTEGPRKIAKEYNKPISRIYEIASRLQIKKLNRYPGLNDAIRKRYGEDGASSIAYDFNLDPVIVVKRAKYIKIKSKNHHYNAAVTKRDKNPQHKALVFAIAFRYEQEGPKVLSKEFSVPYKKVVKMANYRGLKFKKSKENDSTNNHIS